MSEIKFPSETQLKTIHEAVTAYTGLQMGLYNDFGLRVDTGLKFFDQVDWKAGKPSVEAIPWAELNYAERAIVVNSQAMVRKDGKEVSLRRHPETRLAMIFAYFQAPAYLHQQGMNQALIEKSKYLPGISKFVEWKASQNVPIIQKNFDLVRQEMHDLSLLPYDEYLKSGSKVDPFNFAYRTMEELDERVARLDDLPVKDLFVASVLLGCKKQIGTFDERFRLLPRVADDDGRLVLADAGYGIAYYPKIQPLMDALEETRKSLVRSGHAVIDGLDKVNEFVKDGGSRHLQEIFEERLKAVRKVDKKKPIDSETKVVVESLLNLFERDYIEKRKTAADRKFKWITE